MPTTATSFLRSGEALIPIGFDTAPSILAVLLQREARQIQEESGTDDTTPPPPITRQYAAAIATMDITPNRARTADPCQCHETVCHGCPLTVYHRNGIQQPVADQTFCAGFCTGCD